MTASFRPSPLRSLYVVISPVSQLPSQPCFVFEKPAALKIWLASLAGTLGLVSANVVVLRKAREKV